MGLTLLIMRILAALVGVAAMYAAFFMYEDEEGKWQNRIEQLWIGINDLERTMGSRTAAIFNRVAAIVTRTIDRVVGKKLLSFQLIGVSTCFSFAALFLYAGYLMGIFYHPSELSSPLTAEDLAR